MYTLACCDNDGKCIGFLGKDNTIVTDETKLTEQYLYISVKKKDLDEKILQINLGHMLLPNGKAYRVTAVRM